MEESTLEANISGCVEMCSTYLHSFERFFSQLFKDVYDNFVRLLFIWLMVKMWERMPYNINLPHLHCAHPYDLLIPQPTI